MELRVPMVKVTSDSGQGRTFVFIHEQGAYRDFIEQAAATLSGRVRLIVIEAPQIDQNNWSEFAQCVIDRLKQADIRQCALVGFGGAGSLVQYIALTFPRLVRLLTLVDSSFRPHPGIGVRIIDRLEALLPLGLPLRSRERGFDAKPFSQRIRCPALIVLSAQASRFIHAQSHEIAKRIPSAWVVNLKPAEPAAHFCALLDAFEGVPVKCPQKNRVPQERLAS